MSKKANQPPPEKLALYQKLLDTHPEIEKKGATRPYTSVNGHMFTYLSETGTLGIRLSKADRAAFVETYNSEPFVQYGAVMKEYVTVPDELLAKTDELKQYLALSYDYVKSLKPKPTKRKKS